jgi:hypothetical protein
MDTFCEICGAKTTGFDSCRDVYNNLSFYTLSHPDQKFFIHQYIVDAYAAQHASENSKPITTAFALIGLNLFVNYHYTGKQVQNAHIELAKNKREWPVFIQPEKKAKITVVDALKAKPGEERDQMIKEWAIAVWDMWENQHGAVMKLLLTYLKSKNIASDS